MLPFAIGYVGIFQKKDEVVGFYSNVAIKIIVQSTILFSYAALSDLSLWHMSHC